MSDKASLQDRLGKLGQILGQSATLKDSHSPENTPQTAEDTDKQNQPKKLTLLQLNRGGWANPKMFTNGDDAPEHQQPETKKQCEQPSFDELFKKPFDCSNFLVGEPLDEQIDFCLWKAAVAYPEQYIGKANKPRAKLFFDNILQGRVWDFFYLHDPLHSRNRPYLFVPTVQFRAFLRAVNSALGTMLTIPSGATNQDRFCMKFGNEGSPAPRYLKRTRNQVTLDINDWPCLCEDDVLAFQDASPMAKRDFLHKIDIVSSLRAAKDKADVKAARLQEDHMRMLRDAQVFLSLEVAEDRPDMVFIAVDVEAIERPPNPVSEIGLAILDTRDLQTTPPGLCGRDWWPLIKAFHLRTKEYRGLRNCEFVKGCPDAFKFGESTFPKLDELREAIMSIIQPYLDADRSLVIVGHDLRQDVRYLATLGVDVFNMGNVVRHLDSQDMHRGWRQSTHGRSLEVILGELHIPNENLHNAGNDAVYTLRAVVGVSMEQLREKEAYYRGELHVPSLWAKQQV